MKYPPTQVTNAIYTNQAGQTNPWLEAMPDLLEKPVLFNFIAGQVPMPSVEKLKQMSHGEKIQALPSLYHFFHPMDYMYCIYTFLYRVIASTYRSMTAVEWTEQINALSPEQHTKRSMFDFSALCECGAILGVPGIGKTSTIRRVLTQSMPQVIRHTSYNNHTLTCKQVLYLIAECPGDCSIKTMAYNILFAFDAALGTQYVQQVFSQKHYSASALVLLIKQACLLHHVGVIIIDEIQNAVMTANYTKQTKYLVRFLVELMNDTCTAIFLVGTPEADDVFQSVDHLKRRTRGYRLAPMKLGPEYQKFLEAIWDYQYTSGHARLTEPLARQIYAFSNGVPYNIVKLWIEAQEMALQTGQSAIDIPVIKQTMQYMAMTPPGLYGNGVPISDFYAQEAEPMATTRGRKPIARDKDDILVLWSKTPVLQDFIDAATAKGLIDTWTA